MTIRTPSAPEEDSNEANNEQSSGRNETPFPQPFFDAVSGKLLESPVVNPQGDSVEKEPDMDEATYYPNRALEAIIKRELGFSESGGIGSIRRWQSDLQSGWSSLLGQSAWPHEHRPLPESFYCSIACELMLDPVITPNGQTYEREAIQQWVAANGTSPTTRKPLAKSDLRPNNALYELIQLEKGRTDDSVHPSIRRWKESGVASERPDIENNPDDAPAAASERYPTTEEEVEQRRQNRTRQRCSTCAMVATVFAVILVMPYLGGSMLLAFLVLLLMCFVGCCKADGRSE